MTFEDYIKEHGATDLDPDQLQQNQSILDQELSAEEQKARERRRAATLMADIEESVADDSATLFQVLKDTLELCGLLTHNPDWSEKVLEAMLKKYTDPDDPDHKIDNGLKQLATAEQYAETVKKSLQRQSRKLGTMQRTLESAARDLSRMTGEPLDLQAKVEATLEELENNLKEDLDSQGSQPDDT